MISFPIWLPVTKKSLPTCVTQFPSVSAVADLEAAVVVVLLAEAAVEVAVEDGETEKATWRAVLIMEEVHEAVSVVSAEAHEADLVVVILRQVSAVAAEEVVDEADVEEVARFQVALVRPLSSSLKQRVARGATLGNHNQNLWETMEPWIWYFCSFIPLVLVPIKVQTALCRAQIGLLVFCINPFYIPPLSWHMFFDRISSRK